MKLHDPFGVPLFNFLSVISFLQVPGEIFVFGDGDCGQLGLGEDITERLRPFPVNVDNQLILQIVCGGMHTVVLTEDRSIFSWGVNDEGALGRETAGELWEKSGEGTGSPGDSYTPGRVKFPENAAPIVQLSAGDSHTAALAEDGSVWVWGTYRDSSGVMGFSPTTRIQVTPICVYRPSKASEQSVRIASGADHTAAVTAGGALLTWGNGQTGQLGRVGERLNDRTKMETLLKPHAVPTKGANHKGSKIVDVNCGTYATFAIQGDGGIQAFGLNNYGQLAFPGLEPVFKPMVVKALKDHDVHAVRSGQHHTLVVTKEGKLLSFGRPTYGRLGQRGADVSADAACPEVRPVDGPEGDAKVAGAAAGLAVSGCFGEDGSVWMWGFGTSNQLAKGDDDEDEIVPRKVAETKKFTGVKVLQLEIGGQHVGMLVVPKE